MPNRVNRLMVQMELDALSGAENIVFVDYRGLTSGEVEALRRSLREASCSIRVVRNRMFLRALSELGAPDCTSVLAVPTAVIDSECPVTAARAG